MSYQLRDVHARATGFPARRIEVIHNGVDSRRFYPDAAVRAQVRDGLGIGDHEFCIGAVANLLPVKDHMTLLRAVSGLAAVCSNWRLLIAGEGPQRSDLEGFVNNHATWKHRVSFLGSSDCVPDILRALDVYVLPSVAEGISNSLLEAMATGVPPVVSAVGGNPEVVVDGESGLLFPTGDPAQLTERLQSLRAHEELRRRLGKNAMNRAREEFSIESMIRKYEQLYRNVVPALTDRVPAISGI